jgi:hypothetical protein
LLSEAVLAWKRTVFGCVFSIRVGTGFVPGESSEVILKIGMAPSLSTEFRKGPSGGIPLRLMSRFSQMNLTDHGIGETLVAPIPGTLHFAS